MSLDTWHSIGDRTFERRTTVFEHLSSIGNGKGSPLGCLISGHVSGLKDIEDLPQAIKNAWLALRFSNPIVACGSRFVDSRQSYYTYTSPKDQADAQAWADRTVVFSSDVPVGKLGLGLQREGTGILNGPEQLRLWLSRLEDDKIEIVFGGATSKEAGLTRTGDHGFFDGRAGRIALNYVAQHLKERRKNPDLDWGDEVTRLPVDAALFGGFRQVGDSISEADDQLEKEYAKLGEARQPSTLLKLPFSTPTFESKPAFRYHLFDEQTTSAFVKAAKRQGTVTETLDVFWAAAFMHRAFSALPPKEENKTDTFATMFLNAVNQRRYLPSVAKSMVANYFTTMAVHFYWTADELERIGKILADDGPVPGWIFTSSWPELRRIRQTLHWPRLPAFSNDHAMPFLDKAAEHLEAGERPGQVIDGLQGHTSLGRVEDALIEAGQVPSLDFVLPLLGLSSAYLVAGSQTFRGQLMVSARMSIT